MKKAIKSADAVPTGELTSIQDFIPDNKNANRGTEFGSSLLQNSLRSYGAGRSILVDKNNRIIAGNKTAETAASIGIDKVRVIETDGNEIVVVKRIDVDIDSKFGRELAIADNKVAEKNLDWDMEVVKDLADSLDINLTALGFDKDDFKSIAEETEDKYSQKLGEVLYEPKDTMWKPSELFTPAHQFADRIAAIEDPVLRQFFQIREAMFGQLAFSRIADYFANQATAEIKELMLDMALVLLDRDQLIERGFSKIVDETLEDDDEANFQ